MVFVRGNQQDPFLKQGKTFLKEKKYDEAIEILSTYLQSCVESSGDKSLITAEAYLEYGASLLAKEEEDDAAQFLANVDKDDAAGDADEEDEEGEGEGEEEGEGGDAQDEEEPDDRQIAWETLECAKVIFLKNRDGGEVDKLLSDCHVLLGDLQKLNGGTAACIEEYKDCLQIRKTIYEPHNRMLSDVYFNLAVAHIYFASETDSEVPVDPVTEKKLALENYRLSRDCIKLRVQKLKAGEILVLASGSGSGSGSSSFSSSGSSSNSSSSSSDSSGSGSSSSASSGGSSGDSSSSSQLLEKEIEEAEDLIDVLTETINATQQEIAELVNTSSSSSSSSSNSSSSSSSSSSSRAGVTTIGFGSTASKLPSGFGSSTTIGFGGSISGSSGSSGSGSSSSSTDVPVVPVLQVKKKKRPIEETL